MQSMMQKAMWATSFCGRLFFCWVLLAALSLTSASAGDITGTVFRDFDGDAVNDAEEVPVAGIEVEAFDATGSIGTATTAADGSYTITGGLPGTEVRVEFNIPASLDFLKPGITGTNSDALLSFVTMPVDNSDVTVELAVGNPGQHCQADPDFVLNCFINGDQSGSLDVIVSFPSTASNNTPAPGDEALESQIGTTWGMAYQRSSDTLFAASFHKRHAGFGDGTADGTGAIYAISNPSDGNATGTSTFLNLNTLFGSAVAGSNLHPTGSDFDLDAASYPEVGKTSFGDLDISDDELTLWVVNLEDRRLYGIPLGADPANPVAPTLSSQVERHDLFDLFDCDGDGANDSAADVDLRPFALAFNDGLVYVGAMCTGESTADSTDLRALVFSFDPDTDTFTNVLNFAGMTYSRGLNITGCTGGAADWNYWDDTYPGTNQQQVCTFGGNPEISNTQPMLSDLEFDEDGNMYLGIRDRFGDQQGFQIEDPDGNLATGDGYGDLLRATPDGMGGWTISAVEATAGTEFFSDDDWTDTAFTHNETSFGGLALRMGNGELVYTRMDPLDGTVTGENDFAGGVRWKSTATGATIDQYEVYDPDDGATNIFGKGNGLGDIEPICEVPPLELGDRLWCDNGDGVQDPGESGIAGITVTLACDTDGSGIVGDGSDLNVTTTTDASGGYLFNAGNVTGGIPVATDCELRVSRPDINGSCGAVAVATTVDASSGTRSDLRDSDGALLTTGVFNEFSDTVGIAFTTGLAGNSNHAYDFGFRPSDGTVTGDLTIEKTSIPTGPLAPGEAFQYQITISNPSTITHTEIELIDDLPPGVNYTAGSTSVTGPRRFQVRDRFDTAAFDNQDGRDDWAGDWVEVDGGGVGAVAGNVTISGGSLLLDDNPDTGGEPSAAREVDLTGFTQASLEFEFATGSGVDGVDAVVVEVSSNGGGAYTVLETFNGITGATSGPRSFDISSFVAANTRVRFRVSAGYGEANEFFAVEDVRINYASPVDVFRVTEYFLDNDGTADFTGNTYDLTLDQNLASNYFVIVQGSDGDGSGGGDRGPDENYARLTADPFGTGDLATSSGADVITLSRENSVDEWYGVVTVVECLTDCTTDGFQLLDVQAVDHTGTGTSGTDTSGTAWSDINQVMLMGGFNGAGCSTPETDINDTKVCHVRIFPSATDTINWTRDGGGATLSTATSTVMAVEWGSAWNVQRVRVQSANGGGGANAVGEYDTSVISSVLRDQTWVWGTGHTNDNGLGDAAEAVLVTLGDGVNQNASETTVAVGIEVANNAVDFEIYALQHPSLAVDYRFKVDGDNTEVVVDQAVDSATSDRMALSYNGSGGTGTAYPRPLFSARYFNTTTVRLERRRSGQPFPAWVQGIDFSAIGSVAAVTVDNAAGVNPQLLDGAPPNLIQTTDGFELAPGESMTLTFSVSVDSPLDPSITGFTCPATVDSAEGLPSSDSTFNPAGLAGIIGDFVWFDLDSDGIQDLGEPGIPNAQVNLHNSLSCDTPVVETTVTDSLGFYIFDDLPAGDYCVEVYTGTLPDNYVLTTSGNPLTTTLPGGGTDSTLDFGFSASDCLPDIGFEIDALGNAMLAGQIIDNEFAPYGVTISGVGGSNQTMIFDSSNPSGGDPDVGSPNEDFGGPGQGSGGAAGQAFENRVPLRNVLIVSEDGDSTDPDDNAGGGTFTFAFDRDMQIDEIGFLDNGDTLGVDGGEIRLFNSGGVQIGAGIVIPGVGDNGTTTVTSIGGSGVRSVEVELFGSGSIDTFITCGPPVRTASLGDRVWLDIDGDGVQDIGEPGLPNVEVTLYDAGPDLMVGGGDDVAVATALTDAAGLYLFTGLPASTFYVDVTNATVPSGLTISPGSTDPGALVTLAAGATDLDSDFGYRNNAATAVIGDTVWSDADGDGLLDSGEPGISGVTLDLISAGPDGILSTGDDVVEDTATTDADGRYLFTGVAPGKYLVDVTDTGGALTGYTLTVGPQSNLDPTLPILVGAGDVYLLADFGYDNASLFMIDDTAWLDVDRDGVLDPGEEGIPGVTVTLLDSAGDVVATTISDSNGDFTFTGLENGDYTILITDTANELADLTTTTSPAAAGQQAVTLAGADVSGTNFGYARPGVIGDRVWSDADSDGVQDANEVGISGVTVQILFDINNNGVLDVGTDTLVATAVTDAFGEYLFEQLYPGTYVVSIDDTQGALTGYAHTTADTQAAAGDQLDSGLTTTIDSDLDNDFGYVNGALPNVSGNVFHDLDRDGFDDGVGEPGIPGVTIALVDASGNVVARTATDANGDYSFPDVPAGDYTVTVTDQDEVLDDYFLTSGLDAIDITVVATDITDIDFGYARRNELGRIGDFVWLDADRDGVQDQSEPGLPNVTLNLFDAGPDRAIGGGDDTLLATTVTDANGGYIFADLPVGNYYVDVDGTTVPAGLGATTGTTDPSRLVNLAAGEEDLDVDFGYGGTTNSSALGDRVWVDADSDGLQDPGEVGIEGVTVSAVGPAGSFTTTTGPGGFYLFTGLTAGTYTVTVDSTTLPSGLNTVPTNSPISREFDVPADADILTADFGFDAPGGVLGTIGDTVFLDINANGVQDGGEQGIEDVTLNLRDSSGDVIATLETDENGNYDFTGLLAGNYTVDVTDLRGVLVGLNLSAGVDPTGTIALAAGQDFNDADFGYSASAMVGSLGNLVWHDVNGDGDVDTGESGIGGVTIDLWVDVDNNGSITSGVDNFLRTTTTDGNGEYEFRGLIPETYLVDVTDTNGVLTGYTKTTGAVGVDDNSQADPYQVTLTSGSPTNVTADFGYEASVPFTLGGTVFVDDNEDALFNGLEGGVTGVPVRLFNDLDGDGILDPGEPQIGVTTSDGNGDYLFTNLPNGNYIVTVDTPDTPVEGFMQTTQTGTGGVQPATIAGANSVDNDFGFFDDSPAPVNPAAIGDRVWFDIDADGVQDIGEPGIANVTVRLFDVGLDGAVGGGDDVLLDTRITDMAGEYLFPGLDPGTYYVDVLGSTVPTGLILSPGSTDPSAAITVVADQVFLDADFGYRNGDDGVAIIGNFVWSDADNDGLQDPGEPGIGGVTVDLIGPGVDGILGTGDDTVEDTQTTADDGSYLFINVTPGEYRVDVTDTGAVLTGYTLTSGPQSNPDPTDPISVLGGEVYLDADFGYVNGSLFSISDRTWHDIDGDGTQDPGEPALENVTVSLLDASGDVIATAITDTNGDFTFDVLPAGDYTISITDTNGVLLEYVGTTAPATADELDVTIVAADITGVNFGYNIPGQIGDTVWSDADGNDVQDPGEPGIPGVTVELWLDDGDGIFDNTVDTLVDTQVTNGAGFYLFEQLGQGTYFSSVDDGQAALTGYSVTTPDEEGGINAPGTQNEVVLATSAASFLDADFGYQQPGLPNVSGNVFSDLDRDGVDDGVVDVGIQGVTIDLVDSSGVVVATTTTDVNGDYSFLDVSAGDYTVTVTDTGGVLEDFFLTSGLDAIDITVVATDITDIDFGYARDSGTASIGDFVWLDADRDGVQDGSEPGIQGVALELFDAGPDGAVGGGDDVSIGTTTTDGNGLYLFTGLAAGTYYVDVDGATVPSGLSLTTGSTDPSSLISLSESEAYRLADFGYGSTAGSALGDFVWVDADSDGLQDPGEAGIEGVSLSVVGPSGTFMATTGPGGFYLVTGLTAGTYTVTVDSTTLPSGLNTFPTNSPPTREFEVPVGSDVLTADFGFDANGGVLGTIGDTVFLDADADGTQDPGEQGIADVTLDLLDVSGDVVASLVTDENGNYDFTGLVNGTYRVDVTDLNDVLAGLNLSAGTDPTANIILAVGQDFNDADFGYTPSAQVGSLGNLVWHDINGDGDVDAGEPGLGQVTLNLWLDVNGNGSIDLGTDNFLRTETTDSNGEYEFRGLPVGSYLVDVTDTNGVLAGFNKTTGAVGVDDNSQADPYAVTLTTGSPTNVTADFGYEAAVPFNLSGTVFLDENQNATLNAGEDEVSGIVLTLYRDLDGDGVVDVTDAQIGTEVSAGIGDYNFANLPAGDYLVTVTTVDTSIEGFTQTTQTATGGVQPATIVAADSTGNDFGFFDDSPAVIDPAAIGDRVWFDIDGDGVQDIGEPGIPNVTLELIDTGLDGAIGGGDDISLATALTDLNGEYLFSGLDAGTYYVNVINASVPPDLSISPGSVDPTAAIALVNGQIFLDADFGYRNGDPATAMIGNFVWSDADNDGFQDPGEPGINNVTLDLVGPGADGILGTGDDVVIDSTTTDNDGGYLFTGVAPGEYRVDVTDTGAVLTGYTLTSGPQSNTDPTQPISVVADEVYLDADFGYVNGALFSISDRTWRDVNGDGTQDLGEPGIGGVTVSLLDNFGNVVATTVTDSLGDFSFDGVDNGNYSLSITDNDGVLLPYVGTTVPAIDDILAVTVAGADVSGINFGYNVPGQIGDTVWSDANGDGDQDPGEPGISGVSVQLWLDDGDGIFDNAVDTLVDTQVTNGAGFYLFEQLGQGTYFSSVDDGQAALSSYTPTTADEELGANAPGTQIEVTLVTSAASFLDADFGYQQPALPNVSGNVFNDVDRDGVDDGPVDVGIEGVTIDLVDSSGVVVATTTTDVNGDYSFLDVEAGDYTVTVTDTGGVLEDFFLTSGLDAIDITVVATDITDIDFGYARDSGTASIGDFVWFDGDDDGVQDGAEPGIGGVDLELFNAGPDGAIGGGDDVSIGTTTTDGNGLYLFEGLSAGTYYVDVIDATVPSGLGLSTGSTDPSSLISLSEDEDYREADFGYSGSGGSALGDFIWYDADSDGEQDPGEVGFAGITVELRDTNDVLITSTVTDSNGLYLFTGLSAATYRVVVLTAGLPAGVNTQPTNIGGTSLDVPIDGVTDFLFADWGFDGGTLGSIGDTVFLDTDGDGIQDVGESGIEGVTLNLLDNMGNAIATAVTDENGNYDFQGLPAGTYQVDVTDTGGVLADLNLSAGSDPTAPIVLAAAQDYDLADFPYTPSSGLGTLGNLVWRDTDNSGDVDAGESGVEGVTVDLWLDVNGDGSITPGVDNFLRTETTDENGEYEFNSLPEGDYLVTVSDDNNVLSGFTKTSGTAGVDNNSQADPYAVTLTSGSPNNLTADFGYFAPADLNISGTTFFDLDGDGLFEPSIAPDDQDFGVDETLVLLFRDLDGNGVLDPTDVLLDSMPSDGSGDYLFTNLPPGDYIVAVDATGTYVDGATQTTQLATLSVQPVTLLAVDSVDNDFGFNRPATAVFATRWRAFSSGGQVVVEWQTTGQANTLGFRLYRVDDATGRDVLISGPELLPALTTSPQGATYQVVDRLAVSSGNANRATYLLVETETSGFEQIYGPYTLRIDRTPGQSLLPTQVSDGFRAAARQPSSAMQQRLADHRQAVESLASGDGPGSADTPGTLGDVAKASEGRAMQLMVRSTGLHQVTEQTLADGLELSIEAVRGAVRNGQLQIAWRGEPVAWRAVDEAGRGLVFFGEAIDSLYTLDNVYHVTIGAGVTMAERVSAPVPPNVGGSFRDTLHLEEDAFAATFASRDAELDYWHWRGVFAGHPTIGTAIFDVDVPQVSGVGDGGELTVYLVGASDTGVEGEHHMEVSVNGQLVGDTSWTGLTHHQATFDLPSGLLLSGANQIAVTGLLDSGAPQSLFYVDAFDVTYDRLYGAANDVLLAAVAPEERNLTLQGFSGADIAVLDVSDALQPVWSSGNLVEASGDGFDVTVELDGGTRQLWAGLLSQLPEAVGKLDTPSDLLNTFNGAEYMVIAPSELMAGAQALADYRSAEFTTAVVDLADVMDTFNDGIYDPRALRTFLAFVDLNWRQSPEYVVLLGTGNFDYRDLGGLGGNAMPPLMVATPFGLYASDVRYADVDDDGRPEMSIGRLPVLSNGEVDDYLAKLEAHRASSSGSAPWVTRVLLAADDPDSGGNFSAESDLIDGLLPQALTRQKVYLGETAVPEARQLVLDAFDDGMALVNYVGHGGLDSFAAEGLLTAADVPGMSNGGRLPLVVSLTCNVARFEVPGFTALGEELVLHSDGGAVAVIAPSGLSLDGEAHQLDQAMVDAAYGAGALTVGQIHTRILEAYAEEGNTYFVGQIYQLLGDPAAPFVRP